jgi:hypothetical protein
LEFFAVTRLIFANGSIKNLPINYVKKKNLPIKIGRDLFKRSTSPEIADAEKISLRAGRKKDGRRRDAQKKSGSTGIPAP